MSSHMRNLFRGRTKSVHAGAAFSATAGGSGDASEVSGTWIDRLADTPNAPPLCAKLIVPVTATLQSGATLVATANFQDAAATASPADYGTTDEVLTASLVLTGPSGGGAVSGVIQLPVDLSGARQYVRAQYSINMDSTDTDTALVGQAVLEFAGYPESPPS